MLKLGSVFVLLCIAQMVHGDARSCKEKGQFAMTFDNGPSDYSQQLLDYLQKAEVKVSFHFVMDYVKDATVSSNIQLAIDDGHLVGLKLKKMPDGANYAEIIEEQMKIMYREFDIVPKFVRIDTGDNDNQELRNAIADKDMVITSYNLDANDYGESVTQTQVLSVFQKAVGRISTRALGKFISLQNDNSLPSVNATPKIVKELQDKGYSLVRLDDCLKISNEMSAPKDVQRAPGSYDAGENSNVKAGSVASLNDAGKLSTSLFPYMLLAMFYYLI